MIGYGPESSHFVVELTYNYGVKKYDVGNDFNGITIKSKGIIDRAKTKSYPYKLENDIYTLQSPDGYHFYVIDEEGERQADPVQTVTMNTNDLKTTEKYWADILGITVVDKKEKEVVFAYNSKQTKLAFYRTGKIQFFFHKTV